ncbi:origin recognition complex subunit 4 [Elasticomyces elasticus]|nr:origin recognition complex subunit 4 [Elasticomyces elasticus]KAK3655423.1 origin recognition complex subunit 4 [Elasticomyces elasticus]KAK4919940.1 origin recognition complex subunit 4 [Elasticomyces elasticus]KAK5734120.1 origin recognition complex subunit 4 [Elasticomyces elasticus]
MDNERPAKRRKVDTPERPTQKSTPTSQRGKKPITYSSKKPGFQIRAAPASEQAAPKSAHEAWAETKAKGFGVHPSKKKKKQTEAELYDDIDGAHASPQKKARSAGKPKARLDPLRNQRVESATSPAKKTQVVGFFKQFVAPKADGAAATVKGVDARHDTAASVASGDEEDEGGEEDGETAEDGQGDKAMASTPVRGKSSRTPRKHIGGGEGITEAPNTTDSGRKKTFEDEIKELEAAAQKAAQQEKQQETPGAPSAKRRKSDRPSAVTSTQTPPVKSAAKPKRAVKVADQAGGEDAGHSGAPGEDVVEKLHLASARKRKDKVVDHEKPIQKPRQLSAGPMDINEPEDEQGDHAQLEELTPMRRPSGPSKAKSASQTISASKKRPQPSTFSSSQLAILQSIVLEQLTGKRPVLLSNLAEEYTKVSTLIAQTVTAGESNSMLLIGARGSGKSAFVNQILREQAVGHEGDFHVVRLSGFIHTDDKIALREIWRQLGRDLDGEDEEGVSSRNYADTLTTLLALLSHPADQGREQEAGQVTKSVVFVLDEFELFATHPRQTLLYNLFDIAQSRKAPIAVLGLTTKIDVSEGLEKRVKSRFSHRYVYLGLPKSFAQYREGCKSVLCLSRLSEDEQKALGGSNEAWNALVEDLLETEGMIQHLRRLYYTTKSLPEFASSMLLPLATMFTDGSDTDSAAILAHLTTSLQYSLGAPDSKLAIMSSLSTLHLALLICAARLTNIYNTDLLSFALAYEEYKVLASKAKLQSGAGVRVSGRAVAKGAWEQLVGCGLVIEDGRSGNGRVDVGLEEIGACAGQMGLELGGWGRWCREI